MHAGYVPRVTAAAARSVQSGYLRPVDAVKIVHDAAEARIP